MLYKLFTTHKSHNYYKPYFFIIFCDNGFRSLIMWLGDEMTPHISKINGCHSVMVASTRGLCAPCEDAALHFAV